MGQDDLLLYRRWGHFLILHASVHMLPLYISQSSAIAVVELPIARILSAPHLIPHCFRHYQAAQTTLHTGIGLLIGDPLLLGTHRQ